MFSITRNRGSDICSPQFTASVQFFTWKRGWDHGVENVQTSAELNQIDNKVRFLMTLNLIARSTKDCYGNIIHAVI